MLLVVDVYIVKDFFTSTSLFAKEYVTKCNGWVLAMVGSALAMFLGGIANAGSRMKQGFEVFVGYVGYVFVKNKKVYMCSNKVLHNILGASLGAR